MKFTPELGQQGCYKVSTVTQGNIGAPLTAGTQGLAGIKAPGDQTDQALLICSV